LNRIQASTAALSDAVVMIDRNVQIVKWWNHAAEKNALACVRPNDSGQSPPT